jgi:Holliday junction resolvase RusA-like endonuclease
MEKKDIIEFEKRGLLKRKSDALLNFNVMKKSSLIANNILDSDFNMMTLPPVPKSSQNNKIKKSYQRQLDEFFKKKGKGQKLEKFRKYKKVLVYLCIFVDSTNKIDVDNYPKAVLDSLKEYIGDDEKVTTLIIEKEIIEIKDDFFRDYYQQTLLVVGEEKIKEHILKR